MYKSLLLAMTIASLAVPVKATIVTYITGGSFDCATCEAPGTGLSVTSVTADGQSTISYTGQNDFVNAPEVGTAALGLGSFLTTTTIPTGGIPADFSGTFTLTISQASPAPTGGNPFVSVANMSGTLRTNQSTILLTFLTTSGSIVSDLGTTNIFLPSQLIIRDPSQGLTSLQGEIQFIPNSEVPEPGSMALMGSGLLLAGFLGRRRSVLTQRRS